MQLGTCCRWAISAAIRPWCANTRRPPKRSAIDFLEAPDHVLGVNAASAAELGRTGADLFHDPFVLFGFLAGCTQKLGFSTGVLILPQRQTVLVAKQAAWLDVLCGGRFRLGIGVGWNEVEFIGLNENFHNRGRRSEEQVQVMQALWAEPHVTFKGRWHTIEDAGINPRPASAACRFGSAGITSDAAAHRQVGRRLDAERLSARPERTRCVREAASLTEASGRDPAAVGIEVWTSWAPAATPIGPRRPHSGRRPAPRTCA